jgi:hypothetical protein
VSFKKIVKQVKTEKMKNLILTFVWGLSFLFASAKTDVTFKVTNSATIPLNVAIVVKDKKNIDQYVIQLGQVAPLQTLIRVESINKKYNVTIRAEVPNSFSAYEETFTVPSKDFEKIVSLTLPTIRQLDLNSASDKIKNSFYQLNDIDFGFKSTNLKSALESYYGALIIIQPPKTPCERGKELFYLSPGSFSSKVTYEKFTYVISSDIQKTEVSKELAMSLSTNVPMIGKFFSQSTINDYSLFYWKMQDFGWMTKPELDGWNYITAFNNLPSELKTNIQDVLKKNPGSFLVYINKIYAIRDIQYQCVAAKKINNKNELGISTVATINGIYDFSREESKDSRLTEIVIDIDGVPLLTSETFISQTVAVSPKLPSFNGDKQIDNYKLKVFTDDKSDEAFITKEEKLVIPTTFDIINLLNKLKTKQIHIDLNERK